MTHSDNQKDTKLKAKWISKFNYTLFFVQECDNQELLRSFQAGRNQDSSLRMRARSNFVDQPIEMFL